MKLQETISRPLNRESLMAAVKKHADVASSYDKDLRSANEYFC